ncbi:hypothetical protein KC19_9G137000 [Ceratodon purpureus]|uniref:BZIP domain-containing protein n=1 Tax=Ceratodon purpureus TaxID=3225 RepID=A0A8T0GTT1_CERPU|nr:hypothetical protein KC19_9G137000 [Ceratodon purpureus]
MDSVSSGNYDGRAVNWAHPMNNSTHLPPKSPHGSYSMFSSTSLFESGGGLNLPPTQPVRGHGEHRRSPSAGYIPQQGQATWLSDRLGSPDVVLKRCSHRRSSSDSVAFVDNSYQYMNYLENVTEEEEFVLQEPPLPVYRPAHRRGVSADHGSGDYSLQYKLPTTHRSYPEKGTRGDHNINREHFARLRDNEPFQRQQPRHENLAAYNRVSSNLAKSGSPEDRGKAKKHVTLATPNSKSDSPLAPRGRSHSWSVPSFESRSTASESNSHSDDSNDDIRAKSYERFRSDSEARSEEGGDGAGQSHDGCTSSDQVDPKKAKRILANRQSAQRSRVRKLQYISELEMNVNLLETEVSSLSPKVGFYDRERALLSAENALLKQKLAALAKSQRLKDAYNETLKTEVQRLRQIASQQNQQAQQYSQLSPQQQPLSPDSVELQLLRFSKLDLGLPNIPKPKSPTAYSSGAGRTSSGKPSLYPTKAISPTHTRNSNLNANRSPSSLTLRGGVSPPSCMAPGGQTLGGGMMGGAGTSFMVRNSS